MFGPKQMVDFLSRLLNWSQPSPKEKRIYKIVSDDDHDPESGRLTFDRHKLPFQHEKGSRKADKPEQKPPRASPGSTVLIFALIASLLLSLTYIGKLHSTPGCSLGRSQAAFQLATAFKTTLSQTQQQLQKVATSMLSRSEHRTLLVGIVTAADAMERRAMLREVYFPVMPSGVDVLFVFPRQEDAPLGLLLELESQKFGDIVVLNDTLGNEDGLAFAWFKAAALRVPKLVAARSRSRVAVEYSYVMKAEDNTFLHLPNLVKYFQSLAPKPFTYWGRFLDNGSGAAKAAFAVSWDLVQWIGYEVPGVPTSGLGGPSPPMKSVLELHGGVNWSSARLEEWYDSPLAGTGGWAHAYTNETLVVHGTNTTGQLLDAAKHFYGALYEERRLRG